MSPLTWHFLKEGRIDTSCINNSTMRGTSWTNNVGDLENVYYGIVLEEFELSLNSLFTQYNILVWNFGDEIKSSGWIKFCYVYHICVATPVERQIICSSRFSQSRLVVRCDPARISLVPCIIDYYRVKLKLSSNRMINLEIVDTHEQ